MDDLDCHLEAIADGDAKVFGRWAAAVEPTLRLSLMRYAAWVDVEAVLQETLLRVWQVAPRVQRDGRPNSLLRFAQRTATNLAIDLARRHRPALRARELELEQASDLPSASPPDPLLREILLACLRLLPGKPRLAITLRLQGGGELPDRKIAARLGMTPNTFLQNVTRARRLLLDCMKKNGVDLASEVA